jgi:hypothetical protein
MEYVVKVSLGAMIRMSSFTNIGSGIQKLVRGIHRQQGDVISPLLSE